MRARTRRRCPRRRTGRRADSDSVYVVGSRGRSSRSRKGLAVSQHAANAVVDERHRVVVVVWTALLRARRRGARRGAARLAARRRPLDPWGSADTRSLGARLLPNLRLRHYEAPTLAHAALVITHTAAAAAPCSASAFPHSPRRHSVRAEWQRRRAGKRRIAPDAHPLRYRAFAARSIWTVTRAPSARRRPRARGRRLGPRASCASRSWPPPRGHRRSLARPSSPSKRGSRARSRSAPRHAPRGAPVAARVVDRRRLPGRDADAVPAKVFEHVAFPACLLALVGAESATADPPADSDAIVPDIDDEAGTARAIQRCVQRFRAGEPLAPLHGTAASPAPGRRNGLIAEFEQRESIAALRVDWLTHARIRRASWYCATTPRRREAWIGVDHRCIAYAVRTITASSSTGVSVAGFRRLSILTSSQAGHQPMTSRTARSHGVQRGDLQLPGAPRRARGASATPSARGRHGSAAARVRAVGRRCARTCCRMFAFVHMDPTRGARSLIARDRLGIKPLYVVSHPRGAPLFPSEPKAIRRSGLWGGALNTGALRAVPLVRPHRGVRRRGDVPRRRAPDPAGATRACSASTACEPTSATGRRRTTRSPQATTSCRASSSCSTTRRSRHMRVGRSRWRDALCRDGLGVDRLHHGMARRHGADGPGTARVLLHVGGLRRVQAARGHDRPDRRHDASRRDDRGRLVRDAPADAMW